VCSDWNKSQSESIMVCALTATRNGHREPTELRWFPTNLDVSTLAPYFNTEHHCNRNKMIPHDVHKEGDSTNWPWIAWSNWITWKCVHVFDWQQWAGADPCSSCDSAVGCCTMTARFSSVSDPTWQLLAGMWDPIEHFGTCFISCQHAVLKNLTKAVCQVANVSGSRNMCMLRNFVMLMLDGFGFWSIWNAVAVGRFFNMLMSNNVQKTTSTWFSGLNAWGTALMLTATRHVDDQHPPLNHKQARGRNPNDRRCTQAQNYSIDRRPKKEDDTKDKKMETACETVENSDKHFENKQRERNQWQMSDGTAKCGVDLHHLLACQMKEDKLHFFLVAQSISWCSTFTCHRIFFLQTLPSPIVWGWHFVIEKFCWTLCLSCALWSCIWEMFWWSQV